jgi:hypothetical protein
VVVNLAPTRAAGRVRLPWLDLAGRTWSLADRLSDDSVRDPGDALITDGFCVALEGWGSRFLVAESQPDASNR